MPAMGRSVTPEPGGSQAALVRKHATLRETLAEWLPTRGDFALDAGPEVALPTAAGGPPLCLPHLQVLRCGRRVLSVLPWSAGDPMAGLRLEICTLEGEGLASLVDMAGVGAGITDAETAPPAWRVLTQATWRTNGVPFERSVLTSWLAGSGPDGESEDVACEDAATLAVQAWRNGRAALVGAIDAAILSALPDRAARLRCYSRRHDHAHALLALTRAGASLPPGLAALRDALACADAAEAALSVELLVRALQGNATSPNHHDSPV